MARVKQVLVKRTRPTQTSPSQRVKAIYPTNGGTVSGLPLVPERVNAVLSSVNKPKGVSRIQQPSINQMPRFLVNSIPRRVFQKLVREIAMKQNKSCRFSTEALAALQFAVEDFMVGVLDDAGQCMRHAKRKTLARRDMQIVAKLRKMEQEPL